MTAPDWSSLPRGRDLSTAYRMRVTLAIGDGEKTFEKRANATAYEEPNVVT